MTKQQNKLDRWRIPTEGIPFVGPGPTSGQLALKPTTNQPTIAGEDFVCRNNRRLSNPLL